MATKTTDSAGAGATILTLVWLLVSACLAYPVFSLLVSWGFDKALSAVAVFIAICLLYDIPYRARVNAEHQAATSRAERWRSRSF